MVGALGDHVQTLLAGDVEHIYLIHLAGDLLHAVIGGAAVVRQCLPLVGHCQQVAEEGVGVVHGGQVGVNVDEGDAGLLLQGVHILHDAALGLAHVDDHIGGGCQQRLKVQLALAAVELTQQGQVKVLGVHVGLRRGVPCVRHAHQLIGGDGKHHHLRQRTGDGDLLDIGGDGDLSAAGVGENAKLRRAVILGGVGFLLAAGKKGQGQGHCQQQRQQSFCLFHWGSPSFIENAIIPKRRTPGSCRGKSGSPVDTRLDSCASPPP